MGGSSADVADCERSYPDGLDARRAHAVSPMFLAPTAHPRVTVAVAERDTGEFRRQSKDFALHLGRHGLDASYLLVSGRDHFDIILDFSFVLAELRK